VARHQTLGFGTVAGVVVPLRSVAHGRVVLVLVGSVSSGPAVSLLCGVGDVLSRHTCGRPWIIGQHRSNALELLDFGPRRVAILGECLDDINRLAAANGGVNQLMECCCRCRAAFISSSRPRRTGRAGDMAGFRSGRERMPTAGEHRWGGYYSRSRAL
jgi:hypothetical protein